MLVALVCCITLASEASEAGTSTAATIVISDHGLQYGDDRELQAAAFSRNIL